MRAAIIGYGYMGQIYEALIAAQHWELVGVYDIDPSKFGTNKHFDNPEELIAREDVDVVIICTPHNKHLQLLDDCLRNNKNVILEKPLAGKIEEAKAIYDLIKSHKEKSVVVVDITHCFYDNIRNARQYMSENDIGNITAISDKVIFPIRESERDAWLFQKAIVGHGVMLTNGCHLLARILHLFSDYQPKFELVGGIFGNTNALGDIDDSAAQMRLILNLSDGRKIPVNLFASWPMAKEQDEQIQESMVIKTDKGKLHIQAWQGVTFHPDLNAKLSSQVPYNRETILPEIQKGVANVLKSLEKEVDENAKEVHFSVKQCYQAEKMISHYYSSLKDQTKNPSRLVQALDCALASKARHKMRS